MRRGQLSLFAIVGIVFLLMGFVIFLLKGIGPKDNIPEGGEQDAIHIYVTSCLDKLAAETAIKIGYGGGYIVHPGDTLSEVNLDPLGSDSLTMFGGSVVLPYWFYPNIVGGSESLMPPLLKSYDDDDSVQAQFERYIEENINVCLNNFKPFAEQKIEITAESDPDVTVEFFDSKINVKMNYELIADNNEVLLRYPEFETEINVRLKRMYNLAKEITEKQMEGFFLETITNDLIGLYSRLDEDYLPPMYGGIQLDDCSDRIMWFSGDVKKDMKDVLIANIPFIKVAGSDFDRIIVEDNFETDFDRKVAQGVMDRFIVRASDRPHPYIRTDFSYMPDFPMELDMGSDILGPKSYEVNMLVGQYCFMEYRFYYDLKYPVLVSMHDSKSYIKEKEGYYFQFPIMVSLVDNFPRVQKNIVVKDNDFKSYSCSSKQRISGDVEFKVTDTSGVPLEGAFVTFQCGPTSIYGRHENGSIANRSMFGEKCAIGKTGSDGMLLDRLPPCSGGALIEIMHPKYLTKIELVEDITEGEEYDFAFELDKLVNIRVAVTKYFAKPPLPKHSTLSDPDPDITLDDNGGVATCRLDSDSSPVQPNENVLIKLIKLDDENGMLPSQPFAMYTPLNMTYIKVAPGRYTADITLIRNERYQGEMTIHKNSGSFYIEASGPGQSSETVYYPDEDVVLPSVMSGGAVINFTISDNLYDASQIRFYVMDEGKPSFIENVGRGLKDREACSNLNIGKLTPRLQ